MNENIFELKDVYFSYLDKYPALNGIDLDIVKGQRVAIIGANGCGKSTLLHILDGLFFPRRGTVKAFGGDLSEKALADERYGRHFRGKVGLVFQNPDVQLFCPTVKEEIFFGPLNFGFKHTQIEQTFDVITEIFGIKELTGRMPHQLSVGEKRKVAMASVLISGPEVLLLDEPTAGLDPRTSRDLVDLLNRYHADGKTIVTATHDMHIVGEIADIIYVFGRDKRIIRSGPPEEILADTGFLQEHNLIHTHMHTHSGKTHAHPHQHPLHDHPHA
ncbi:MAG: ATP-binding cassette domain-containing protein [Candidatus Omnitrophica bacterium]|nr:ATP-binding cassette domain-containing protein [Candidatus Omnitrophota bacterium]